MRAASSSALGVTRKRSRTRSANRPPWRPRPARRRPGRPAAAAAATTWAAWAWARLPSTHDQRGVVQVEGVELEGVDDGHVGDRRHQLAAVVEDGGVGAGGPGTRRTAADVGPALRGHPQRLVAERVVAHGRHQAHRCAEQAEARGDVAADPAGRDPGVAGVAGGGHERRGRARDDVHVGAADDHHPLLHAQILTEAVARAHSQDPHR